MKLLLGKILIKDYWGITLKKRWVSPGQGKEDWVKAGNTVANPGAGNKDEQARGHCPCTHNLVRGMQDQAT